MRALRVIGLDADGRSIVCEDPENGDSFAIPVDDRLKAGIRGDLTRLGRIDADPEPRLRPREIQARIRAGASMETVAEAAGIPVTKVERYAYPVLLERSRAAEIARAAHPVRADGPAVETLLTVVTTSFSARSQDIRDATWDAWRGEDGRWIAQLRWSTGRSDNVAHWRFQPGAHGGTIVALDDHAADLVDPDPTKPLRPVTPVTRLAEPEPEVEVDVDVDVDVDVEPEVAPEPTREEPERASDPEPDPAVEPVADTPTPPRRRPGKGATAAGRAKGRPDMPSWEDVLLGVRSQRG